MTDKFAHLKEAVQRVSVTGGTSAPIFVGSMDGVTAKTWVVKDTAEFKKMVLAEAEALESKSKAEHEPRFGSYLPDAVFAYFANGGGPCCIVNTPSDSQAVVAYRASTDGGASLAPLESMPEVTISDLEP